MANQKLLDQALHCGAIIHQPHALKAFLSAQYLAEYLGESNTLFSHTSTLMKDDAIWVLQTYAESVKAPPLPEFRIHRVLERGVYPASYQAIFQWHQSKGFQDIFEHFAHKASLNNEYLSHNVTILLAMNSVYQQLSKQQIPTFLNRFTEFVTSTFSNTDEKSLPHVKVSVKTVLASCIKQFGFFGHNLITLAWLLRCKNQLSVPQYEAMLSNLQHQANSPLEDPEDNVELLIWQQCESGPSKEIFVQRVNDLVFNYTSNLHQITLADALCLLQSEFSEHTADFSKIAQYQCLMLEKCS